MCGIVGAILRESSVREGGVVEGLIEGLRLLEYRGYDSAGVALIDDAGITIRRKEGRIENLERALAERNGKDGAGKELRPARECYVLEMLRNVELMSPAVRATGEEAFEMGRRRERAEAVVRLRNQTDARNAV